jgi:hypothetical protein
VKARFRYSQDNASGYFDYRRYQISHELRYRAKPWEILLEVRFARYEFPVQTIGGPDSSRRRRHELICSARTERSVGRHLRLTAGYDYERTVSNLALDEYSVNMVSAGVQWDF